MTECEFSEDPSLVQSADVLLWTHSFFSPNSSAGYNYKRPSNQLWVLVRFEPPHRGSIHVESGFKWANAFNWTGGYRLDSTLPTLYETYLKPEHIEYLNEQLKRAPISRESSKKLFPFLDPERRPALPTIPNPTNKSKMAAWFVSNLEPANGRTEYALELSRYLQVDVFSPEGINWEGHVRPMRCEQWARTCFEMLARDYRFYLSFENSNCRHYITEKFFLNALKYFNWQFRLKVDSVGF